MWPRRGVQQTTIWLQKARLQPALPCPAAQAAPEMLLGARCTEKADICEFQAVGGVSEVYGWRAAGIGSKRALSCAGLAAWCAA